VPTARKSNIIGVFGDSFTENRYLDDQFTLTTLLDGTTEPQARVVNYGVSAYGVDQAYLRYKKFEDHDIRHVVYLFCANDLRNLSETRLAHVVGDDVVFRAPEATLASTTRRALGRLRLTYLVLWVYADTLDSTAASDLVRPDTRPRLVETRSPECRSGRNAVGARIQGGRFRSAARGHRSWPHVHGSRPAVRSTHGARAHAVSGFHRFGCFISSRDLAPRVRFNSRTTAIGTNTGT
jgi:hypothetical protein